MKNITFKAAIFQQCKEYCSRSNQNGKQSKVAKKKLIQFLQLYIFQSEQMRTKSQKKQQLKYEQIIKECYSPKLQQLNLSYKYHHWKHIVNYRNWEQLKSLQLTSNKITDSEITIITRLKWTNLAQLIINQNSIRDLSRIWDAQWPNLQQISLDNNKITAEGLSKLVSAPITINLKLLNLSQNPIGSRGAKLLSKVNLPVFQTLSAWGCQLGYEGMAHLTKAQWPSIKKCIIFRNNVGSNGMRALTHFNFPTITKIVVIFDINIWEAVSIMATNFPVNTKIGRFHHSNKQINKEIINILKKRLSVQE